MPVPPENYWIRKWGWGLFKHKFSPNRTRDLCFNKHSRWFWCSLKFDVTKLKLVLALTTCCIDCEFNRCYYFIIIKGVALESQGVNVPGYFDDCWIMWKYNGLLFKKKNRSINIIHGSIRLEAIYFPYQKKNHYPSVRDRNHICTFQSQTIQTSRTKPTISCLCRLGQFTLCISVIHL